MHPLQTLRSRRAGSAFAGNVTVVKPVFNRETTKAMLVAAVVVVQVVAVVVAAVVVLATWW